VDVLASSLAVLAGVVRSLTFDQGRMREAALQGYVTATSLTDTLVEDGLPFRAAHHLVGRLVADASDRGVRLDELPDEVFLAAAAGAEGSAGAHLVTAGPALAARLRQAATLEAALARPRVIGGTAPERVAEALREVRARLDREGPTGSPGG
jgi:argininosuccinate lyase